MSFTSRTFSENLATDGGSAERDLVSLTLFFVLCTTSWFSAKDIVTEEIPRDWAVRPTEQNLVLTRDKVPLDDESKLVIIVVFLPRVDVVLCEEEGKPPP